MQVPSVTILTNAATFIIVRYLAKAGRVYQSAELSLSLNWERSSLESVQGQVTLIVLKIVAALQQQKEAVDEFYAKRLRRQ